MDFNYFDYIEQGGEEANCTVPAMGTVQYCYGGDGGGLRDLEGF